MNFDNPPEEAVNDSATQPMNTPLMEPEEIPPELSTEQRQRTRKRWDNLPPPRVTRSRTQVEANLTTIANDEVMIDAMVATAIEIFLARAGGPDVQQALNSAMRDQ